MLNLSTDEASPSARTDIHAYCHAYCPGEPSGSPGSLLVQQGSIVLFGEARLRGTFRIAEGCLCLSLPLATGRRQILDILGPGRLISADLSGIGQCGAVALAPTRLDALDPTPENRAATDALRQMLARARAHATLLGRKTMTERVAFALLDLAEQFAPPGKRGAGEVAFSLHLTRADLADWLGLTLSTVSRCLNAFKQQGLIAFDNPKRIAIRDRDGLAALASGASVRA